MYAMYLWIHSGSINKKKPVKFVRIIAYHTYGSVHGEWGILSGKDVYVMTIENIAHF